MRPSRIHPAAGQATESVRVIKFRDGARLLPDHLENCADADEYPDLTYDEWVNQVANKSIAQRSVDGALGLLRIAHFGNR
jgi:hypothetical protein